MDRQKIITVASVIIISGTAAATLMLFAGIQPSEDAELSGTFLVEGIYYESQNYVEIRFRDSSENTESVTLEILGMEESFQQTYDANEFVKVVRFAEPPRYGWAVHPITMVIQHNEYGTVNLKTEIHPAGKPAPPVIFGTS